MTAKRSDPTPGLEPERGLVLAVLAQGVDPDDELAELEELARTAGVEPIARLVQHRPQPDTRSYVGKGKLDELKQTYADAGAEVLVVDDELSPSQQKLLENQLEARVIDRTQLILDIFAQRAKSRDGKLQVELAQLRYDLPRLTEKDAGLSRLAGGIGGRGPGETVIELGRRRIRDRIRALEGRWRASPASATYGADGGATATLPVLSIVGYTNVGQVGRCSTSLTDGRRVGSPTVPLETLDPTTRGFEHRRPPLPRHRHRRLHPPAPASTRRRLRRDTRGDTRRGPRAPRRRRLRAGGTARRDDRRGRGGARRDRRARAAAGARHQQDRRRRPAAPAAPREPLPGRAAGIRAHRRRSR